MFLYLRIYLCAVWVAFALVACGDNVSSTPPPTDLVVTPGETMATLTWTMRPGVDYVVSYSPNGAALAASSPFVVSGLTNGTVYDFTVNARAQGDRRGPDAPHVTATPDLAGSAWVPGGVAGSATLNSVVYGTRYVAGAADGQIYTSADGVAWAAAATNPNGLAIHGGVYFQGQYWFVGDAGLVMHSADPLNWGAPITPPTSNALNAIAHNGSMLVAVGQSGTILTSSNGTSWTTATSNTGHDLLAVTYFAGTWTAVGVHGTVATSPDAVAWTATSPNLLTLRGIAAFTSGTGPSGSRFAVVGHDNVGDALTMYTNDIGAQPIIWLSSGTPSDPTPQINAVTYGSQFVAVGANGAVIYGTDGRDWTAKTSTLPVVDLMSVARGGLQYVAVGAGGASFISK
ncbi:MAG: fibronectin type III domain-containing protein [Aquabacterium sp.]|nr:fibronectin type III domain-containing protein [Aquabacterium sp.]